MNIPQISIIFPTYLRPKEIVWNLEYFRKKISIDYEVFILDNSPEPLIHNFQANENYIFLNENIGTASRNIGIKKAKAPYILLLDDDSHPETGEVERIIAKLKKSPENIAGLICEIHNPDGNREASLLPTVFHGAGVAFKTEALRDNNLYYPDNYCFYGEEYRLTLEIYSKGYSLQTSDVKIIHRRSPHGRDLSKIFYYLARNNAAIWQDLTPEHYLKTVLYDSQRRYELTAQKENVTEALKKGLAEELPSQTSPRMLDVDFENFSLINKFKQLPNSDTYILCGTGKFTTLWTKVLEDKCSQLLIADFNKAFHNKKFGRHTVLSPKEAIKISGTFLVGHSSILETLNWQKILQTNNLESYDIRQEYELKSV